MKYAKNLIKRGVEELIESNEDLFKQNLIYALSIKLNESVETAKLDIQNEIFKPVFKNTTITEDVNNFVNFLNGYKNNPTDKILLKDKSLININESEIKSLQMLFENLSPKNRQKMAETIFDNQETFKQHINFYKDTEALV